MYVSNSVAEFPGPETVNVFWVLGLRVCGVELYGFGLGVLESRRPWLGLGRSPDLIHIPSLDPKL